MGSLILGIAFVIEVAFAAYSITIRSPLRKVRSYIRIGALAAFVLLALLSIIEWGFRWYLLAALLFVWAVLGLRPLLRKQADNKAYRPAPRVLKAAATLLLVFIAVIPALVFPQYKLPPLTGKYPVATATYSYTDAGRIETFSHTGGNRKVNVQFWYPKDAAETYPLVVFSHGAFGMKASNTSTFIELASNGYVVCSIDHPYHSLFTIDSDRQMVRADPAFLQEFLNVNNGKYDDATELQLEQQWMSLRVADINFVIDTILQQAKDSGSDPLYHLVDTQKIGLMGHSLGGESSAQVARARAASGLNDIDAVIDLDADLSGEYLGIQDGKPIINNEPYPAPILVIFSDTLVGLLDAVEDPNQIAVRHVLATAPNAYEVHLTGTDHMSLTDLPLVSPFLVSIMNASVPKGGGVELDPYATIVKMNETVLHFFDAYLKGQSSFTTPGTD